uniref:Segment polarity protein dishevelled homolog DVL-3-like n=1 Tax=Mastacembelus armatus TaxID=205130 RepID=A0A3Q3RTY6_9TELE
MGETKIIYHLDDQETPYLVKLSVPADKVTLADFKNVLKKPNYKFFFKSMDDDFGVVKEEISDDNAKLPCFNGRVVSWLVSGDGANTDAGSVADSLEQAPPLERTGGIGDSRPPSYQSVFREILSCTFFRSSNIDFQLVCTLFSYVFEKFLSLLQFRFSSSTEQSSSRLMRRHRRRRRKPKASNMDRSSSFSSITDSTMSLNIITVTLNMEKYNFLGISIVGQSNERGDGGIYIGSIMKGGAVAADGRIEPGDMLLQVNDINFENMSNDDAVRVLRDIVHKPGPITLTVAKCWDPNPRSCFALPRSEPIRPIDPAAWVSHTAAMTGVYPPYGMSPSMSTVTSTSSSISSSIPETERESNHPLQFDMATVAKAMACPESGLEVRDRMWLKITIANAFIGSDVVDWLFHHVEGFSDRREARKYASNLLKAGYIRHTVNKITFSEQCYYVFGDLCGNMAHLSLHDHDGSSGGASDQDTLPPLPHPGAAPWPMTLPYQFPIPHPYDLPQPFHGGPGAGSAGSQHSGDKNEGRKSGGSGSESEIRSHRAPSERSVAPPSERSVRSSVSHRSANSHSITYGPGLVYGPPGLPPQPQHLSTAAPGAPPGRELASVPPELTASRQSLRMAVGNAGEFFVDVM